MCIIHLFNTSVLHIFYRTQVLHIVHNFSKIFEQKFFFQKHVLNIFVLLPHRQPESQQKNFLSQQRSLTTFTHCFFCFQDFFCLEGFCFQSFASALLVTLVENELSLEP